LFKPLTVIAAIAVLASYACALNFDVAGSYKNLFSASNSLQLDLNRFRLQVRPQFSENFSGDIQYDFEAYLGSTYAKPNFRTKIYRGYFTYSFPGADLRVGRQRIPWGVGRVWNPTDPFNPIDFTSLEREERAGVDALSVDLPLGPLAGLNLVLAASRESAAFGGRLKTNLAGLDLSLVGAKPGADYLLGFDFAGQLFDGGVRGEAAYTRGRPSFVLGYDYTFPNSLYFLTEYYFNGQSGAGYEFAGLTYDIFSLLKGGAYFLYNMSDGSYFANPFLDYALTENSSWAAGGYLVNGRAGSEYNALANVYYAQVKWFF